MDAVNNILSKLSMSSRFFAVGNGDEIQHDIVKNANPMEQPKQSGVTIESSIGRICKQSMPVESPRGCELCGGAVE